MAEQSKRPVGRPETGKTVQFHTITLPIGLLDKVKELNPGFKLSGFVAESLQKEFDELNKPFTSDLSDAF